MSTLYSDLAHVYEAMYKTFIDYKEEYLFYSEILRRHGKNQVLEIGCGTGNLANYFLENNIDYLGLDFSKKMISVARKKSPKANFRQGDMRNFRLAKPVQSALITARTLSYILTNKDLQKTFSNIHKKLQVGGILSFDIIDAQRFIPDINADGNVFHLAENDGIEYRRNSFWKPILQHGMDLDWTADYLKKENKKWVKIGTDEARVRSFTKDEILIFLELAGFEILGITDRPSYFFPTYVFTARKR